MMPRGKRRAAAWKKIESKLQVADIILTRDTRSALSGSIRKILGSYWNHAVIVFFVPNQSRLFKNILIISAEDHGIEIHRIQKYTKHFDYLELGVKRIPGLSEEVRARVLSFLMNNVDIPYDYLRLLGFLLKFVELKLKGGNKHVKDFLINKDTFVCSSFIQKAFYNAVAKEQKQAVVFKNGIDKRDLPLALEEVTPADIARSNNCEWIYNPHD